MEQKDSFNREKKEGPLPEIYPLGIQDFSKIVKGRYVYIDKTQYIAKMLTAGGQYYFLARPRRFGKSLLMSTLEAYFEGRRDLFKGLALDALTDDWQQWPVVHIDLSGKQYETLDDLRAMLGLQLRDYERKFEVACGENMLVDLRLRQLLKGIYEKVGKEVVVLIDEYDKPLMDNLEDEELCDKFRSLLKGFYGNLKSCDRYIRFGMLTGITRFAKLSIFSDLNNLDDISMDHQYAAICGLTQEELETSFPQGIANLMEEFSMTHQEVIDELRRHYDGYHFTEKSPGLYNPFSLLKVMRSLKMDDYWYETGTPSVLIRRIRKDNWSLPALQRTLADPTSLRDIYATDNPIPLLFQTGYLTIKWYDAQNDECCLGYPNIEVKNGVIKSLFADYVRNGLHSDFDVAAFRRDITKGDVDAFMTRLQTMLSNIPSDHRFSREFEFQNVFYIIFMMVGERVQTEVNVGGGRCDMVIQTAKNVYVFEFKFNKTLKAAMTQLRDQGYAEPFRLDPRPTTLIAANYSSRSNNLSWQQEPAFSPNLQNKPLRKTKK